ncbi:RES domain protein [mine drainage metagenome]|uniref:RES domain protein n=1 Tax=mine drainage metagenome TaxID=410659 RepID=T1B770_9ZZZZ
MASQAVGDAWLRSRTGLLLPVPSALLAHATNHVINPAHAQAATHLAEGAIEPFWFDKRYLH